MDQAPLIVSVVAVVLGGVGLIGGVIGYVQGTTAVARATNARQRAVVAEEEALQARAAADAAVRTAEELVERAQRSEPAPRSSPATPIATGSVPVPTATGATVLPPAGTTAVPTTGPTALPTTGPTALPRPEPAATGPVVVPAEWQPAEHFEIPAPSAAVPETRPVDGDAAPAIGETSAGAAGPAAEATDVSPDEVAEPDVRVPEARSDPVEEAPGAASGESEAAPALDATAEPPEGPGASRDDQGRVVAGAQDAPTMDWAEVLRTGAIPLPSRSRGTYAAPRRRPRPTGDGPARFELRAIGRQRFEAVNVGGEPAEEARIEGGGDDPHLIRPLAARPSTVPPAGTLAFSVLRVEGRHAAVAVTWVHAGEPVRQELLLD